MDKSTCDLCDENEALVQVAEPVFTHYGGRHSFSGLITTLKCFEDNSLVRDLVSVDGHGKVLVVDGGGSKRRSLLGDQLAATAVANRWEGIVIYGAVRDVEALGALELGVMALCSIPLKTEKNGIGQKDLKVYFAGVAFASGMYLYADRNGLLLASVALD